MNKLLLSLKEMPEFLSTKDLVKLNLYPSIGAAYVARKRKLGPKYIKMHHKILYPKNDLIAFLEKRLTGFDEDNLTSMP